MQRADVLDVEPRGLAQHGLHLRAVLADDVGVVAAGLVYALVHEVHLVGEDAAVERAEGAEGVGGEEYLVRRVVGHHDLGPVDHRGHDEGEVVPPGAERVALGDDVQPRVEPGVEEVLEHRLYLGVADDGGLGVLLRHVGYGRGVVGLHVGDDQVVELAAAQLVGEVFEEVVADRLVDGIEQNGLLVFDEVGVIGHAVGHAVDALKEGKAPVVSADPDHIVGYALGAIH